MTTTTEFIVYYDGGHQDHYSSKQHALEGYRRIRRDYPDAKLFERTIEDKPVGDPEEVYEFAHRLANLLSEMERLGYNPYTASSPISDDDGLMRLYRVHFDGGYVYYTNDSWTVERIEER